MHVYMKELWNQFKIKRMIWLIKIIFFFLDVASFCTRNVVFRNLFQNLLIKKVMKMKRPHNLTIYTLNITFIRNQCVN